MISYLYNVLLKGGNVLVLYNTVPTALYYPQINVIKFLEYNMLKLRQHVPALSGCSRNGFPPCSNDDNSD